ncbi:MAG: hypothetical protein HY302_07110 [Opitutae bacterium]|nr:hypothetical protein [Opitutae bacterium]
MPAAPAALPTMTTLLPDRGFSVRLALLMLLAVLPIRAADNSPSDDIFRRAVVGTWLHEKNAGVATVAVYTIYREDGVAHELVKIKFAFQKATSVWTEYRWSVAHGVLHLAPVRSRAQADAADVNLEKVERQLVSVTAREMHFRRKGKERQDRKVVLPGDVQKMFAELAAK